MKILITGSDSFLGKNLKAELLNRNYSDLYECNSIDDDSLESYVKDCDFIFHLLTVYRSEDKSSFIRTNCDFTDKILRMAGDKRISILLVSSLQADNGSLYGNSKLQAEDSIRRWVDNTGNKAYIYRLANEFGKWCPPNTNSVIATFCFNTAHDTEISVNDPAAPLKLMYIDDIVGSFISTMEQGNNSLYCDIHNVFDTTVGEAADIIRSFKAIRSKCDVPSLNNTLVKLLYSVYLSYLPEDAFSIGLEKHIDIRGSFTELLHFGDLGQVSVNITKPGITKGNHWHHTKTEKFIVIAGKGIIKFRKHDDVNIIEYHVSDERFEVVDIPPGYIHNITNYGDSDLITIMWANELFDDNKPDTFYEEV